MRFAPGFAAALCTLFAACSHAPAPARPEKAKITLSSGEDLAGIIQYQTDTEIGIMTDKGQRTLPMSEVLFVQLEGDQPVNKTAPAPAPVLRTADLLQKFQPPADGILTIAAGETLSVVANQRISADTVFSHQMMTAEVTDAIPAQPVSIPDGASATLEVLEVPVQDKGDIVLGLAAVNINGHRYKVVGGKSQVLGPLEPNLAGGRKAPGRTTAISTGSVISWKLKVPVQLREEK